MNKIKDFYKISEYTVRRLPKYVRRLSELSDGGVLRVSSSDFGRSIGHTASQIRQDMNCFGGFGQQGHGYEVEALRDGLLEVLGANRGMTAIVVGAGNIGRALMENFDFSSCGVSLKAAFDVDPAVVGSDIRGIQVYAMEKLQDYLSKNRIDIAILCVPQKAAKAATKYLTDCGIDAVWNFTNTDIVEPDSYVLVENVHFTDSLLVLSYNLAAHLDDVNSEKNIAKL